MRPHLLQAAAVSPARAAESSTYQALYEQFHVRELPAPSRAAAREFLNTQLAATAHQPAELPDDPSQVREWMKRNTEAVTARYADYLAARAAGGPRRYFTNRAHALYFLRGAAPTKRVDGSWLYGLVGQAGNPRFAPLVQTYLDELGEGVPSKNHVGLYRKLLTTYGVADVSVPDDWYLQGAVQLALGWQAQEFLPEIVGFNLGYEQLPLHLLITAYELNELGIDPYYFTLHVTVDNADSGHADMACTALEMAMPVYGDVDAFWQRVRRGAQLGCAGTGTCAIIESFDIESEVVRIFAAKSATGHGAHSDYCKVAGKSVNAWLSDATQMPAFLQALTDTGWIRRGAPPEENRFWKLLVGERAEMFGVFSPYELQVIFDWIRQDESTDGQAYFEASAANQTRRRPSFRAQARQMAQTAPSAAALVDPDVDAFRVLLALADAPARAALLDEAMGPALHWTPVGLHATREFTRAFRAV